MSKSISKINITLSTNTSKFTKGMRKSAGEMKKFKRAGKGLFRGMQGGFTRMIAMVFALRAAFIGLSNVMKQVFERETIKAKLQIFERTLAKTNKTFSELSELAAKTPFRLNELAKGMILLRALGGKELGTVDMVRKLGDAAITTGVGFDIIAANVGRMFNALKKGNIGQTANELRSYGLLSTEVQDKIEAMGKAGADQGAMFEVFMKGLKKFDGAMKIMSLTMTGVISTFKDLILVKFAEALQPWLDIVKQVLIGLNKSGALLAGFAAASKKAFKALEDIVFGRKKMNPELERFISLMITAPKVIMKGIMGVIKQIKIGFGDANKQWSDLAGKSNVFLFILNKIVEVVLTVVAMLPRIAEVARKVQKLIRGIITSTLDIMKKSIGTGMSFVGSILKTVHAQAEGTMTSIAKAILVIFQELRIGELIKASISGDAASLAKLMAKISAGIGGGIAESFMKGGASIDAAVKKQATDLQNNIESLKKSLILMFEEFDKLSIGKEAQKNIDGMMKKMRKLLNQIKASKFDLGKIEAIEGGASAVNPGKKFADLVTAGSDKAYKALIGQMFDVGAESAPVEEKQLVVQKAILRSGETLNSLIKRSMDIQNAAVRIY